MGEYNTTYLDNKVLRGHAEMIYDIASGHSGLSEKDINMILNKIAIELELMAEEFEMVMETE